MCRRTIYGGIICLLLTLASGARCAQAATPAPSPDSLIDEVVVMGERTGPGMWHVHRGAAHLWILGSMAPLPRGITWRSKQVEHLLDSARQVLVSKPVELGMARAVWLMVTEHRLLLVQNGNRLKDVLPKELYARFAEQRAKYSDNPEKWERYRPIIAAAFLQQAAFHKVGLSTRLDFGAAVRLLAKKHGVPVEEIKIAGVSDVLEALKTLTPATESTCVAASLVTIESDMPRLVARAQAWADGNIERIQHLPAPGAVDSCRAALDAGAGAGDLIALAGRSWLTAMQRALQQSGVTVAVTNMDVLLEPHGLLDELRAAGYSVEPPSGLE